MAATATADGAGGLLERAAPLGALDALLDNVRERRAGRLVLVGGEAGIGKTSLVRAFCAAAKGTPILRGACDPLGTPRPLGPFVDIAEDAGGGLSELVREGAVPGALVSALARELRGSQPPIVVLEDLQWADEATLDVLRLLGRRIESLPALVVATYRDDELDRTHPLRVALGDLPRHGVERVTLAPLSRAAVSALAGADAAELHSATGGNPFFVTEVLAGGSAGARPDTVRDAVLARAARLDPAARALLDAVAVVPQRAEIWLLEALAEGDLDCLEACLASGMLRAERDAVAFRHEIARLTLEEALAPHVRIALHRRACAALREAPAPDLARIVHHAKGAGDVDALLRYGPEAAERAARLRAHREAAAHLADVLHYADRLPPHRRAELLERRSYECYLTDLMPEATAARRAALEEHRALGDRRAEGDAHRWLSRLSWFSGDNAAAEEHARRAIALLEPLGSTRELAMAYSNMAQLRMLDRDEPAAREWGTRAIALAEALGETEILVHALNNVGTAAVITGNPEGRTSLERSLRLALAAGLEEHVARAYTNLAVSPVDLCEYALAERWLDEGIAYCVEHDLDAWRLYMTGYRALAQLETGRWDDAAVSAAAVLDHPRVAAPSRIAPLVVLGTLRARRGDPDPWSPLDEALALATPTGELQRLGRVACARAEAHWIAGDRDGVAADTDAATVLAAEQRQGRLGGQLVLWRRRAGIHDDRGALEGAPEPIRLELAGDARAAAAAWTALGCPTRPPSPRRTRRTRTCSGRPSRSCRRSALAPWRAASPAPCGARASATCARARGRRPARTRRA